MKCFEENANEQHEKKEQQVLKMMMSTTMEREKLLGNEIFQSAK